jgi:DnaJ family protein A protein 2
LITGDIEFQIEQKPHPRFTRKGDDLIYQARIHLYTALAGGKLHIEHLETRSRDANGQLVRHPHWLMVPIHPGEVVLPGMLFTCLVAESRS